MTILLVILGLVLLAVGGDILVRGAVGVASRLGVSPLLAGLTIVGFGTSTPELMTSVEAAMAGSPAIAWGNIVGSNIVNVLVILGVAVLITPIVLRGGNLLRDTGVCAVASLGLLVLGATGWHGAWIGLAMVVALVVYIVRCYRDERVRAADSGHTAAFDRQQALEIADTALHQQKESWWRATLLLLAGLALLMLGARFLVSAAIDLAHIAGLSEAVKLMNMHRPTISEMEAGNRRIAAHELAKLADLYDTKVAWLLGEAPERAATDDPKLQLAARELSKLKPDDLDRLLKLIAAMKSDDDEKEPNR